jgi:hypothetical protein
VFHKRTIEKHGGPNARPLTLDQLHGTLRTFVGFYPFQFRQAIVRTGPPPGLSPRQGSAGQPGNLSTRVARSPDRRLSGSPNADVAGYLASSVFEHEGSPVFGYHDSGVLTYSARTVFEYRGRHTSEYSGCRVSGYPGRGSPSARCGRQSISAGFLGLFDGIGHAPDRGRAGGWVIPRA